MYKIYCKLYVHITHVLAKDKKGFVDANYFHSAKYLIQ